MDADSLQTQSAGSGRRRRIVLSCAGAKMPKRGWRNRHAPRCAGEKEFVRSAALALATFRPDPADPKRGTWVCPSCQALERGTAYKYRVAVEALQYRPGTYEELLDIIRHSKDARVPGRQPGFVAERGKHLDDLIAARRAGKGGLSGPAKTRAMLVANWKTPKPTREVDVCEVCGKLLIRGTSRGSKRVLAHQPCWWEVQRSPEGRAWMAAYMERARTGRRSSVGPRPYRPGRQGRPKSAATLTRHFGWAVRRHIGSETFVSIAASEHLSADAVEKGVARIVELLPPMDRADRTMRRYVLAFDDALGRTTGEALPLRRAVAACGTAAGYKRHRRNGEPACAECAQAERDRTRAYSEKRRREAGIAPR